MKEIGITESKVAMGKKFLRMGLIMKENFSRDLDMEEESSKTMMEDIMMEILLKESFKDK